MIRGEAVSNFTLMFLQMWNHDEKKSNDDLKYLKEAHDAETETTDTEGYFLAYGESPFDGDEVAKRVYLDMIQSATDYIYIMTPYLVLDDEMIDNITYARNVGSQFVSFFLIFTISRRLIWQHEQILEPIYNPVLKSMNLLLGLFIRKWF
jgi:phosphatidylserine/phosphatidylglycerophosphate/cardiolipin synthase-like enzyme